MDKIFWKKTALGLVLGAVLGSAVPVAATIYFWKPLPEREEVEGTDKPAIDDIIEKTHGRRRPLRIEPTPRHMGRNTVADKHFDLIMSYVKTGLESNYPYSFQKSYSEFLAENQENLGVPKDIYKGKQSHSG